MNSDLPAAIRLRRVAILGRWREAFARSLEDSCLADPELPAGLLPGLFDEILDMLQGDGRDRLSGHGRPPIIGHLAEFPNNLSVCLKLLNTGEAAIREFLINSAPEFASEPEFERECLLWDLKKVTHVLIHREVQGICEQSLRPITEIFGRIEGHRDFRCRQMAESNTPVSLPDPEEKRVSTQNTRIR